VVRCIPATRPRSSAHPFGGRPAAAPGLRYGAAGWRCTTGGKGLRPTTPAARAGHSRPPLSTARGGLVPATAEPLHGSRGRCNSLSRLITTLPSPVAPPAPRPTSPRPHRLPRPAGGGNGPADAAVRSQFSEFRNGPLPDRRVVNTLSAVCQSPCLGHAKGTFPTFPLAIQTGIISGCRPALIPGWCGKGA
jgi:hypothetical protein